MPHEDPHTQQTSLDFFYVLCVCVYNVWRAEDYTMFSGGIHKYNLYEHDDGGPAPEQAQHNVSIAPGNQSSMLCK